MPRPCPGANCCEAGVDCLGCTNIPTILEGTTVADGTFALTYTEDIGPVSTTTGSVGCSSLDTGYLSEVIDRGESAVPRYRRYLVCCVDGVVYVLGYTTLAAAEAWKSNAIQTTSYGSPSITSCSPVDVTYTGTGGATLVITEP